MSNVRGRSGVRVSLFPFLSILSCVIGTLTLLTAGLTAGNEKEREEELERERQALVKQVAGERDLRDAAKHELALLKRRLEEVAALADAIRKAREELERLRGETGKALAEKALLAKWSELQARRRNLEDRLRREKAAQEQIEKDVKDKKVERDRARDTFVVRPGGSGQGLEPAFVLCSRAGLILDPDGPSPKQRNVLADKIVDSDVLKDFLTQVKSRANGTAIFLIQPGGVHARDEAAAIANRIGARHGSLAIPSQKKLDFSLLRGNGR